MVWWEYVITVVVPAALICCGFLVFVGFVTRFKDSRAGSSYGNPADSLRRHRWHARRHGEQG
jgi:hypothetical protein